MFLKLAVTALAVLVTNASGCSDAPTADQVQTTNQETMQQQAVAQIGLPNIVQFREMRTLKMVEELADTAIPTYSYLYDNMHGCLVFLGPTFGYPIPYATQYTSPQKQTYSDGTPVQAGDFAHETIAMPQADPNGLFKPADAAGTWILMANPKTNELQPQYIEADVETFTFRVPNECKN